MPRMQRGLPEKRSIRGVKKVVAVSSAKGGVGKSTIAGIMRIPQGQALSAADCVGYLDNISSSANKDMFKSG